MEEEDTLPLDMATDMVTFTLNMNRESLHFPSSLQGSDVFFKVLLSVQETWDILSRGNQSRRVNVLFD